MEDSFVVPMALTGLGIEDKKSVAKIASLACPCCGPEVCRGLQCGARSRLCMPLATMVWRALGPCIKLVKAGTPCVTGSRQPTDKRFHWTQTPLRGGDVFPVMIQNLSANKGKRKRAEETARDIKWQRHETMMDLFLWSTHRVPTMNKTTI